MKRLRPVDRNLPTSQQISPFLKWAGGKRWFAYNYLHLTPSKFNRYIEPFLGSGAIFFALRPTCALLSDINGDLINCYEAIKSHPIRINSLLVQHHRLHSQEYYYEMRRDKPSDAIERAAWFVYLNRTCWNGLYRVNRKNIFNVPIGTKTNVILPTDDFDSISKVLSGAEILHQDFEDTIESAGDGDFVFVDPPYTVKHNMNGFLKYNDRIFSWADQLRLRDAVKRASNRGAMVLVTNANHHSIREIYADVGNLKVVSRLSVLSAKPEHRGQTEELAIRTWFPEDAVLRDAGTLAGSQ